MNSSQQDGTGTNLEEPEESEAPVVRDDIADKDTQFPDYGEEYLMEKQTKEILAKAIAEMKKQEMTDQDIERDIALHAKRAAYEMDAFVKMSEVRKIMGNGLTLVMDKINKTDKISLNNKSTLQHLEKKVSALNKKIGVLLSFDAKMDNMQKLNRNIDKRVNEYMDKSRGDLNKIANWMEVTDERLKTQTELLLKVESHTEQTRVDVEDWQFRIDKIREELHVGNKKQFSDQNMKIYNFELALKEMPMRMDSSVKRMKNLSDRIEKLQEEKYHMILDSLKVDEERIQALESKVNMNLETQKRLIIVENRITNYTKLEDDILQVNLFMDRTLPQLIHLQLCEGLNVVAGNFVDKLKDFENRKAFEIIKNKQASEDRGNYGFMTRKFRRRIDNFFNQMYKAGKGNVPFVMAEGKDWWPNMPEKEMNSFFKINWFRDRNRETSERLEELKVQQAQKIMQIIGQVLVDERNVTRAMCEQMVAANVRGSKGRGRVGSIDKRKTLERSPLLAGMQGLQTGNSMSATDMSAAQVMVNSLGAAELQSRNEPVELVPSESAAQQSAIGSHHGDISPGLNTSPGIGAMMGFPGGFGVMGGMEEDSYEEKIYNQIFVVRKFLKKDLTRLKLQQAKFVNDGKREFLSQLDRWKELYDELQTDTIDFAKRVTDCEEKVDTYQDTSEALDAKHDELEIKHQELVNANQALQKKNDELMASQENLKTKWTVFETSITEKVTKLVLDQAQLQQITSDVKDSLKPESHIRRQSKRASPAKKSSFSNRDDDGEMKAPGKLNKAQHKIDSQNMIADLDLNMISEGSKSQHSNSISQTSSKSSDKNPLKSIKPAVQAEHVNEETKKELNSLKSQFASYKLGSQLEDATKQFEQGSDKLSAVPDQEDLESDFMSDSDSEDIEVNSHQKQDKPPALNKQVTDLSKAGQQKSRLNKLQQAQESLVKKSSTLVDKNSHIESGTRLQGQAPDPINIPGNKSGTRSRHGSTVSALMRGTPLKTSGSSARFNFQSMNKGTLTREEMTKVIENGLTTMEKTSDVYLQKISQRSTVMEKRQDKLMSQIGDFTIMINTMLGNFMEKTKDELLNKGFAIQVELRDKIQKCQNEVFEFNTRLEHFHVLLENIKARMAEEYEEFCVHRMRWKNDFEVNTKKHVANIDKIYQFVERCEQINVTNSDVLNNMLESLMIDQLITRQDVADRQNIMMLGFRQDQKVDQAKQQINSPKTTSKSPQPQVIQPVETKRDASTRGAVDRIFVDRNLQDKSAKKINIETLSGAPMTDSKLDTDVELDGPLFDSQIKSPKQPVLKVDRECLSCSDNSRTMAQVMHCFKMACLMYAQSPVPYNNEKYHVEHMLDARAKALSKAQRILREQIYQSAESMGIKKRYDESEKSFIIQGMMELNPTKKEAPGFKELHININEQQHSIPSKYTQYQGDEQGTTSPIFVGNLSVSESTNSHKVLMQPQQIFNTQIYLNQRDQSKGREFFSQRNNKSPVGQHERTNVFSFQPTEIDQIKPPQKNSNASSSQNNSSMPKLNAKNIASPVAVPDDNSTRLSQDFNSQANRTASVFNRQKINQRNQAMLRTQQQQFRNSGTRINQVTRKTEVAASSNGMRKPTDHKRSNSFAAIDVNRASTVMSPTSKGQQSSTRNQL